MAEFEVRLKPRTPLHWTTADSTGNTG